MKNLMLLIILSLAICKMEKEKDFWDEYKITINKYFPSKANKLNKGTSIAKLTEFENKFDINLPKSFKRFYIKNNGERENTGYIAGLSLLSLEKIDEELSRNRATWVKADDFNRKWTGNITPEKTIKKVYYNKNWIPIISDLNGNYLAMDLDPNENGKKGQIINFGSDEHDHFVISDDFNYLFKVLNDYILSKGINDKNLEGWGNITDLLRAEILKN